MNTRRKTSIAMTLIGAILILSVTSTVGLGQSKKPLPKIIFTSIENPEQPDDPLPGHVAVIFVFQGGAWRLVPAQHENSGWVYAASADNSPYVWGIAEGDVESRGEDLEIVRSLNHGSTWSPPYSLKKISFHASFESLSMNTNGKNGSLTISLKDNLDAAHKDGYYTYNTTNGGLTWSKIPRYSQTAPKVPKGLFNLTPIKIHPKIEFPNN